MTSHPNRATPSGASNPSPEKIRAARESAGLTQTAAASLIHSTLRAWQEWEAGNRRMHPGLWELFGIKAQARQPATPSVCSPTCSSALTAEREGWRRSLTMPGPGDLRASEAGTR